LELAQLLQRREATSLLHLAVQMSITAATCRLQPALVRLWLVVPCM
jgi:hypothetical protein